MCGKRVGKDILKLLEAGRTLDLTSANVTLRDIEGIDIAGSGNRLVISVDAVKAASSTTDTLEVVAKLGDTIAFGSGWRIETPKFINGQFTHLISESATGGTAKVEIRNDRPLTNPLNPFDANRDGNIQPLDALRIINEVRRRGAGPVVIPTSDSEINRLYFDVNGDMRLTALDALRVINAISRINHGLRASGESTTPFTSAPDKVHAQLDVKSEAYTPDMMSILAKAPLPRQQTFVSANMGLNRIDEFHYEYGLSDEGDKSKSTPTDLSSLKPSTLQN